MLTEYSSLYQFQFTPLREGRPVCYDLCTTFRTFQFTPLREGRLRGAEGVRQMANFNSRPSARGDGACQLPDRERTHFNSRPSARGDAIKAFSLSDVDIFQFTPLREGRLEVFAQDVEFLISIHAPPRGATALWQGGHAPSPISIHAPPRGATHLLRIQLEIVIFQFTPLREGRLDGNAATARNVDISIHAPPRGATAKDMQFLQIFCSTLTNQHGLTIVPRNLSRLFW